MPKLKTGLRPARAVLNDWPVSGIATFQSGAPTPVGYRAATALDTTALPAFRRGSSSYPIPYYRRASALQPELPDRGIRGAAGGSLGTAANPDIRRPGVNNWDIARFKTVPIRERLRFQPRCEAYNIFNHTQFSTWEHHRPIRCEGQPDQCAARSGRRRPQSAHDAIRVTAAVPATSWRRLP